MTFVRLWRFRPAPGREREFERVYGAYGEWAALFRRAPAFEGTTLLRQAGTRGDYVTIDRWATRAAWDAFRLEHAAAYGSLDAACASLTALEESMGEYMDVTTSPEQ